MIIIIGIVAAILLILLVVAFVMLSITLNEANASSEEFNKKLVELSMSGYSNSWMGYCGEMGPTNYFGILT